MPRTTPPGDAAIAAPPPATAPGATLVVKFGGSAMEDPAAVTAALRALIDLAARGYRIALVHGGGKPIDRALAAAGLDTPKIEGRRFTDDAALDVVVRTLGDIAAALARQIEDLGGTANPLHGAGRDSLFGEKLLLRGLDLTPIDLGRVGSVSRVELRPFDAAFDIGAIPVVPSLARDDDGAWLNVNADTAAAAVAAALRADLFALLTDTPGVLKNPADPASRCARLTEAECDLLAADGAIDGGMTPKVEGGFAALRGGAKRAVVIDGRTPDALYACLAGEAGAGTELVTA